MLVNVIGDVMMTAGVVAYLGAFTVSIDTCCILSQTKMTIIHVCVRQIHAILDPFLLTRDFLFPLYIEVVSFSGFPD